MTLMTSARLPLNFHLRAACGTSPLHDSHHTSSAANRKRRANSRR
jgi:hypothetical protein